MLNSNMIMVLNATIPQTTKIETIFDFIKQPFIFSNIEELEDKLSKSIATILICNADVKNNFLSLIEPKVELLPHLSIIFLGEIPSAYTMLQVSKSPYFIQSIEEPIHYSELQEVLKLSDQYHKSADFQSKKEQSSFNLQKNLVGSSNEINQVRELINQVSCVDANVLILGESGTGKEITAQSIHNCSHRSHMPFVPINCGAIPADLLESELFGHEKGAFTGAISTRKGRFELANGGTLFLDEIGDMPLAMQVKLLRVLQERQFERIGSNQSISVDVRIIAATHQDLDTQITKGTFREDLFYRLNVFPIHIPPLRQRVEDIPLLIQEIVSRLEASGQASVKLMIDAVQALCHYSWPGNIRELANMVERLSILYPNGVVDLNSLPSRYKNNNNNEDTDNDCMSFEPGVTPLSAALNTSSEGIDLKEHLVKTEICLITQALEENNWVVARAADFLNMRRTTLVEKIRKHKLIRSEKV